MFRKIYSAVALLLVLSSCLNKYEEGMGPAVWVQVGDSVPDFVLTGTDGKVLSTASLDGKAYILNFFDTGCPDCREELDVLQRLYDDFEGGLTVLNVPRSQTRDQIQAYWDQAGLDMPFFIPHDKDLYYRFASHTIPRTYVVDRAGKVYAQFDDNPVAGYETLGSVLKDLGVGTVNLTLKVCLPMSVSGTDVYNFHNEYTVSRLDVYLFDSETGSFVAKNSVNDLIKSDSVVTEYDITYLFRNMRIKVGVYDIFAVANYGYSLDVSGNEMEFLNTVDSLTYQSGIEANLPDTGPVMTNRATSLLAVDLTPWIGQEYVLTVNMERVMAKLQIGVSKSTFQLEHDGRKYADINITNYKLVNLNRRYYLFQHKDRMAALDQQPEFTLPTHFGDVSGADDEYVVDPLFYRKTGQRSDAERFGGFYRSWFGDFTTTDFASMPAPGNFGYAYILENTAYRTSQKDGYMPGIVFKAAVSPVFVYLYDYFSFTLKEENRPEYWPNTLYLYKYNFYGSIQAINTVSGLALDDMQSYTDAQLKAYGIKQCKFNMGVYETYYTYWIRHNTTGSPLGAMSYGVVRNNYYQMVVTGVNGVGDSRIVPDILRDTYPNSYVDVVVD